MMSQKIIFLEGDNIFTSTKQEKIFGQNSPIKASKYIFSFSGSTSTFCDQGVHLLLVIVLYLPKGLAGIYDDHIKKLIVKFTQDSKNKKNPSPTIEKEESGAK